VVVLNTWYAVYPHACTPARLHDCRAVRTPDAGRRAAWFVIVGCATVIANFTLVNLFFSGLHAYSGLWDPRTAGCERRRRLDQGGTGGWAR